MTTINISIITSLYNCERFLETFLCHFFKIENLHECELILVHNDPTEEEIRLINNHDWQGVRKVHLQIKREGLYSSWNRAIKAASGKYIAIWNVDDIRTPDSLSSQKQALDNSSAAMCYGDFYGTSIYGPYKERFFQYCEFEDFKNGALRHHVIGCFPMWRRDIHEKIGYLDEQFKLVSDYEFQLRVLANYKLVKAGSLLGYYLEFQPHKLSSNHFLQDTERAVVEFRYKYYDKVLMHTLPFIFRYKREKFLNFGNWYKVADVVPSLNVIKAGDVLNFLMMPIQYFLTFSRRGLNKLYRILFQ
jgi:glycosyltransferase involved in cell wall biosynthesis